MGVEPARRHRAQPRGRGGHAPEVRDQDADRNTEPGGGAHEGHGPHPQCRDGRQRAPAGPDSYGR